MEIRVLKYFLAIAREENITVAAESLHITQPTLSRQLMDLENELGKQLFIRGKRRVTLTEEGTLLRKHAEDIIAMLEKAEMDLKATDEVITGELTIGGAESEAMRIIARVVHRLHMEYPEIHYNIYSKSAPSVTEMLDRGLLDFGVIIRASPLPKYEYITLPHMETWGILMRRDSPLTDKEVIRMEDLKGISLIVPQKIENLTNIMDWLGGAGLGALNIIAHYSLFYNAALLVEKGMGYALCIDKMINSQTDPYVCFRPLYPSLNGRLSVIWKKYTVLSKAASKFLERLREEIHAFHES